MTEKRERKRGINARLSTETKQERCVCKNESYLHRRHLAVRQSAKIRGGPSQKIVRLRSNRRFRVKLENVRERRRYVYLLGAVNPLGLRIWHFAHGAEECERKPRQAEATRDERIAARYRAIRFIRGGIRHFRFDRYFERQYLGVEVNIRMYNFNTHEKLWKILFIG